MTTNPLLAKFDSLEKIGLDKWSWPNGIDKLKSKKRDAVLAELNEAVNEAIQKSTVLSLDLSEHEFGRYAMSLRVNLPLGPMEESDLVGYVPFDAAVDDLIDVEYDAEALLAAAAHFEDAAKKLRAAVARDNLQEGIERPINTPAGSNVVALLNIDGEDFVAPLTKTPTGYSLPVPRVGTLQLPVIVRLVQNVDAPALSSEDAKALGQAIS